MITAIDFETTKAPKHMPWCEGSYPVIMSVVREDGYKSTWVFNHNEEAPEPLANIVSEIQEVIDEASLLVAHNTKFELLWLRKLGVDVSKKKLWCTQVGEYVHNGQDRRLRVSLAETAKRRGLPAKHDKVKEFWDAGYETDEVPLDILVPYCEHDTWLSLEICKQQIEEMRTNKQLKLARMEMELVRLLADIEWNGMLINVDQCEDFSEQYADMYIALEQDLHDFVIEMFPELENIPVNLNSDQQLSVLLFGGEFIYEGRVAGKRPGTTKKGKVSLPLSGMGLTPKAKTETKKKGIFQVDVAQLTQLKTRSKKVRWFISSVMELSKIDKMKGTYFDGLLRQHIDGVVHQSLNQTVTVTGRLSCSKPKHNWACKTWLIQGNSYRLS